MTVEGASNQFPVNVPERESNLNNKLPADPDAL